jgi:hypothetical protein
MLKDDPDTEDTNMKIGVGTALAGMNVGFRTDTKNHWVSARRAQDLFVWDTMLLGLTINEAGTKDSDMGFNCDLYSNNGTYLYAVGFNYDDMANAGGDASLTMTTTFGVESAWTDWATVRLGYSKGYDLMNQVGTAGMGSLGLGFNYGSFNLDMGITSSIFTDPIVYLTGNNNNRADETLGTGFKHKTKRSHTCSTHLIH